jgi:hypothetical protein
VPSDGIAQEAYQYTGIVKADNVDETKPERQSVDIKPERQAQEANSSRGKVSIWPKKAKRYSGIVQADDVDET